jgi:hypothetical protein
LFNLLAHNKENEATGWNPIDNWLYDFVQLANQSFSFITLAKIMSSAARQRRIIFWTR